MATNPPGNPQNPPNGPIVGKPMSADDVEILKRFRGSFFPDARIASQETYAKWLFGLITTITALGTGFSNTAFSKLSGLGIFFYSCAVLVAGSCPRSRHRTGAGRLGDLGGIDRREPGFARPDDAVADEAHAQEKSYPPWSNSLSGRGVRRSFGGASRDDDSTLAGTPSFRHRCEYFRARPRTRHFARRTPPRREG